MSAALLDEMRALIQRDVNNRGLARDPRDNLFTRCRDDFANACRSIADTAQASVVVMTGFFIPHAHPPCGETDGPLGALFLARAFSSLDISFAILTDAFCHPALEVGLHAASLPKNGVSSFFPTPVDKDWQEKVPYSFVLPTHLLALERAGPGFDGHCRNMHGSDVTEEMAPAHQYFEATAKSITPIATIGIGDGGNEIGMGKIPADVIARNIPHGERIACRVPTDHLIVAGVSNWGAYALAAGVALLRRQRLPASLFDLEHERELLRVMVEQGPLVDGVTARQTVSVDGLSFDDYAEPLRRIGKLLEREQCLI
ncbi:MAG: DUF4392 domain-containing protein [Gemmataceae bacterium]